MNVVSNGFEVRAEVRNEQGFSAHVLSSRKLRITVVPELGAKIISLKDLHTGREWMWHPRGGLKLFRNRPGDDFSQSPLVGVDEGLPTVPLFFGRARELPDQGELWCIPWGGDGD